MAHHESLVKIATCNLNQWALDFEGNLARIRQSIIDGKRLWRPMTGFKTLSYFRQTGGRGGAVVPLEKSGLPTVWRI